LDLLARILNPATPPLIVAEMSGNHGGDLNKAFSLVFEAHRAGADAIKLQTYTPETITVSGTDRRFQLQSGLWKGQTLSDLYQRAMTPWEWHPLIAEEAAKWGLVCFSSPFDESAVGFLEDSINPPIYKVASFELNHFPMLRRIGCTGKPVLASIGVSEGDEISQAIEVLTESGCPQVILLHCVSEYPAKPSDFCLQKMPGIQGEFGVPYGLSDHSLGHLIAVAGTALGARVIEKHFCLDREDDTSVDAAFSMTPAEFSEMVKAVKMTHQAISGEQIPQAPAVYKRSILVSSPILSGDLLGVNNIRIARPGDGLCPSRWEEVLGTLATKNMDIGHPLSEEDFRSLEG